MKKLFTLLTLLTFTSFLYSQYYYIPASAPGNPGGLNTDSEYPNGSGLPAGWSVILGGSNTSPTWSSTETIPFPFNFNGNPVTQYKVSSTGVLTFHTSTTLIPSASNTTIPDPGIPDSSIMVWGIEGSGSNDAIVTKTFGSSGSQQHWVFFASYTAGSWTYWSIVLEEGSDNIYIVDQRHSTSASPQITAGIQIDNTTAYMVAGSPSLSNVAGSNALPDDNHYYEFIYGSQNAIDVAGLSVTTSPYLILGNAPFTISGEVSNLGSSTINSMDLNYSINLGNTVTESVSNLSINSYDNHAFNHGTSWTPTASGTYLVSIWASNINGSNDMDLTNDTAHAYVNVFTNYEQRNPMFEVFTSSTCGPCVAGNTNITNVLSGYPDQYTLLKYQMSWPGSGDPYYTQEGGDRRTFYSVNSVPRLEIDGGYDGNPSSLTAQEFDSYAAIPSFTSIDANYSVDSQSVDINVSINPLENLSSSNLKLHCAIFEYMTYNNTGSNGEIEFAHVMKKMVNGSSGYTIPALQGGIQQTYDFSYTFQGQYNLPANANTPTNHMIEHSVEDFDNLGVAVWIQDDVTKEIFQSTTASNVTGISNPFTNLNTMVFPNPASNLVTLAFEYQQNAKVKISIFNILGEIVLQKNVISNNSLNKYQLDVSNLNNGIYNVVISADEKISIKQLQIIR